MARPLVEHFADRTDPRVDRTKKHRLDDIPVIALSALVCGATTFEDIEEFAESREDGFKTFLPRRTASPVTTPSTASSAPSTPASSPGGWPRSATPSA